MESAEVKQLNFSRRDFLRLSGQAGFGALALSLGGSIVSPLLSRELKNPRSSGLREIHLETREIMWDSLRENGLKPWPTTARFQVRKFD